MGEGLCLEGGDLMCLEMLAPGTGPFEGLSTIGKHLERQHAYSALAMMMRRWSLESESNLGMSIELHSYVRLESA